jgi:hypothetical protein
MSKLSIKVKKEFLKKEACMEEARKIISEGRISGMSELQLAHEIYFHALAFFFCEKVFFLRWVNKYADPIDMRDGGDTPFRRFIFAASWNMTKGNK